MSILNALNSRWVKIPAVATLSGLLLYQSCGLRHWDKAEITRMGSGTTIQHLIDNRTAGRSTGATIEAEHKLIAYSVANAVENNGIFVPRVSAPGAQPVHMNTGVNTLLQKLGYVQKFAGGSGSLALSPVVATLPGTTTPPVEPDVVEAMDAGMGAPNVQAADEHVKLYLNLQNDAEAAQTATPAPSEKPDQSIVVDKGVARTVRTPYITNLSAKNLRFKTHDPYVGQTIAEIQEGDVKAFIPVGLHHELKKGRARKTLDEMVKNGVVTERGVMATPYTDSGFKANRSEILKVPLGGNVVMHQPEGTSIRLSQRYNAPEINKIVGDNVISEAEKRQLGNKVVVFEVEGSNSYLVPVQVSPEAKMPPATKSRPTVTQLAPRAAIVESGYVAQVPAQVMRQIPVTPVSASPVVYVEPQFRGRNALHNEMMYMPSTVAGTVTRTEPVPSTVTRMTPNVETGYSTGTVTRIESGFVGLRSSVKPGYGLLGTTYEPVLVQHAPTVPDWNKVVPVTRIPAYK